MTPRTRVRRTRPQASRRTPLSIGSSGSAYANSRKTPCSRSPRRAVPQFELYQRTPTGLSAGQGRVDALPDRRIAVRPKHVDPDRGVDEDQGSAAATLGLERFGRDPALANLWRRFTGFGITALVERHAVMGALAALDCSYEFSNELVPRSAISGASSSPMRPWLTNWA